MRTGRLKRTFLVSLPLVVIGCASPLDDSRQDAILRQQVSRAIDREIARLPEGADRLATTQPPSDVVAELADRREELDALGPQPFDRMPLDMGMDLTGSTQSEVSVNLESAVATAVRNNLGIQASRLQPAINESDVVAAEAAFDAVFVNNVDITKTDQPSTVPVLFGRELGTPFNASERYRFETGLRKPLTTGGQVTLTTDLTRFRNNDDSITFTPNPAYTSAIRLGVEQPLLRGFGTAVNTATIRLSRNAQRRSIQDLRSDLLIVVDEVDAAYWDLVFAWDDLANFQWLLDVGIEIRDVLAARREFDVKRAEYSDAVARVEQRKRDIISARRAIRRASDRLKALLHDPQLSVGSEALLVPVDKLIEAPVKYSLREAIMVAVRDRPEVQAAILDIDDASIRQILADNGRLPLLNLAAEMAYFGMDDDPADSYDDLLDGDFIEYIVGAKFEYPIGNRAAEAEFRKSRLQRSTATIAYQQTIETVVLDVKAALRDVVTNYELIQANRSFRIAQAENLRTIRVLRETTAELTPTFLDLMFTRQERLADAERQEMRSLVNYNQAVSSLYRAMGVGLEMNRIELEIVDDIDQLDDDVLDAANG